VVSERNEGVALHTVNWEEVFVEIFQQSPTNFEENYENRRIVSASAGRDSNWRYPERK
jgi:hypothetical protein